MRRMKYWLGRMNDRFYVAEKISILDSIAIKTISTETQKKRKEEKEKESRVRKRDKQTKKHWKQLSRAPVSNGTILSSSIHL